MSCSATRRINNHRLRLSPMTLDTFLANGFTLRWIEMVDGGAMVAVVVDHVTEPVVNQGRFTVAAVMPEPPVADDQTEPTVLQVGAEYNAPVITAANGAVFDASQYEMR